MIFAVLLHPIQEGQLFLFCPFGPGCNVLLASFVYNVCIALLILSDLSLRKTAFRCNQFLALLIHLAQQLFHALRPCIAGIFRVLRQISHDMDITLSVPNSKVIQRCFVVVHQRTGKMAQKRHLFQMLQALPVHPHIQHAPCRAEISYVALHSVY